MPTGAADALTLSAAQTASTHTRDKGALAARRLMNDKYTLVMTELSQFRVVKERKVI